MKIKNALVGCLVYSHKGRSDDKLIESIAAGNEDAMRTLYARHHVRVYHFIVRLGFDTDRAEDIVSEVFLTVWRQAGSFENRSQVRLSASSSRPISFTMCVGTMRRG
jgi:sigma-70-like protein